MTTGSAADPPRVAEKPILRAITAADITEALAAGLNELRRAKLYSLFFGLIYAAAGALLMSLVFVFKAPYLPYPLAMGFALVAPFMATGLYDISRRLERGEALSWTGIFGSIRRAGAHDLRWMALVTAFTFVIWMDIAALLTFAFLGFGASDLKELLHEIFTTANGLTFLVVGNAVGALIALAVFAISAVSYPLLFDRDIDFVTAMTTSVRLVLDNPGPMLVWGALIGILILLSLLSAFVGLIVVLPFLGHATWHLYRRAVAPSAAT